MDNYIKNLIAEGEHQQLDFKFEIRDTKKIARSLVAFANTNGGKLLVGVKDNGVITGNLTGTATTATTATTAITVSVASAGSSNLAHSVLLTPNSSSGSAISSDATITFNPSTEILSVSGLAVTSTTGSSTTTTGALIVSGGVGIGGSFNVGNKSRFNDEVYITNHGAKGGDWFGVVKKSENYGWKILGWGGTNYTGTKIGPKWKPGFTKAIKYWVPSIAASSMVIYKGKEFQEWNGDALITSLKDQSLRKIKFKDINLIKEDIIFKNVIGRIRDIEIQNKTGEIFLLTDQGSLWRLYK